jgi:hypothetical protein
LFSFHEIAEIIKIENIDKQFSQEDLKQNFKIKIFIDLIKKQPLKQVAM